MTLEGIKKALTRKDEIECFVLTSTFKLHRDIIDMNTLVLNESAEMLEYTDVRDEFDYFIDITDIDLIIFNKKSINYHPDKPF